MPKSQKAWKRGFWVIEEDGVVYLFDGKGTPDPKTGEMVATKKPTKKDIIGTGVWFQSNNTHGPMFDHVSADLRSLLVGLLKQANNPAALFIHLTIDLTSEVPIAVVSE